MPYVWQTAALGLVALLGWQLCPYFTRSPLDDVPGPKRKSLVLGNIGQLLNLDGWDFHRELGTRYGSAVKLHEPFGGKGLYVFDPKAIYHILVKEQYQYTKQPISVEIGKTLLGDGLLSVLGERHRKQRKLMNPVFSIAHMKHMAQQFYAVSHRLCDAISAELSASDRDDGEGEVDLMEWMTRTAAELIGQAGLGYSLDTLTKDGESAYARSMKALVPTLGSLFPWAILLPFFTSLGVPRLYRVVLPWVPNRRLQRLIRIVDTMDEMSKQIYRDKLKAFQSGEEARGMDIMSILLKANIEAAPEDRISEEEVVAQMSTLMAAAMETTSTVMAHILYLLCQHPDLQDELREEIRQARARSTGDVSYQDLDALPLFDAICRETLRLYPPISGLDRMASEDLVLPLSAPQRTESGSETTEVFVPKGTHVIVSVLAANRSAALWGPDALEWRPKRWLKDLPESLVEAKVPGIYANTMTFGAGSFSCIGFKFSQLEMKVVISQLIAHYAFELTDKEIGWKMGNVQFPVVEGASLTPSLPLRVRRL